MKKWRMKLTHLKWEHYLFLFFLLQPLIDMYRAFFQDTFQIAGLAAEEAINLLFSGLLLCGLLYHLMKEKKKKTLMCYLGYGVLLISYLVLHCINIMKFDTSLYEEAELSVFREIYYIVRMYVIPLGIMVSVYNSRMSDRTFITLIKTIVFVVAGCIVFTNLFEISFVSYSEEDILIRGNIFHWFSLNETSYFEEYTSRGWFYSANQISAMLFAFSPIIVYEVIKKFNIWNCMLLVLQIMAMIMIGTTTAGMGALIICFILFIVALFLHIIKKETWKNKGSIIFLVLVIAGGYFLYTVSPYQAKENFERKVIAEEREEADMDPNDIIYDDNIANFQDYVRTYAYFFYINEYFLDMYPVHLDEEFWQMVVTRVRTENINYRTFKSEILERIVERNDNPMDKYLGVGYTANIIYNEKDYVFQYYLFGIGGLLLLIGPYYSVLAYSGVVLLRKFKDKFTLQTCAYGLSLCVYLAIAFFSGHVFISLFNMLFIGLFAGKLLLHMNKKDDVQ